MSVLVCGIHLYRSVVVSKNCATGWKLKEMYGELKSNIPRDLLRHSDRLEFSA